MKFLRDESGATAAEYVLLMGIVCTTLAVAALTFSEAIAAALGNAGAAIGVAG
ncbi:Flp family type IVb pilin [Phenylobacterium sp.]|jgi:pilus assembly protein Flp/PilA|uniref:Flp family type IVb pilin n=1 Tax=Phenylobacterium sp. TaxID=1871053 RepID=UPI002EDADCF0